MRRTAFALLLILSVTLAQELSVTLDQARATAEPYAYQGESLDMKPQALTYAGASAYWVFEITSMGQVSVMIPVNAETGTIDTGDGVTDVLKTHYLANFLVKDTAISDFLDATLTLAQQKQDMFGAAKADLETYEQQLPSNITLSKLSPLKTDLDTGVSRAEALRADIIALQAALGSVQRPEDITGVTNKFSSVFSKERSFLSQAKEIASSANDFKTELAGSPLKTQQPDLTQAFSGVISTYRLTESVTATEDSLSQNENTINGFLGTLDTKAAEYLTKLKARVSQSGDEQRKKAIIEKLNGYLGQYQNSTVQAVDLPEAYLTSSGFDKDSNELVTLLNSSIEACAGTGYAECFAVEEKYTRLDYLTAAIEEDIANYNPSSGCSGGKELINGQCACPSGTVEQAGECVSSGSGGAGLNWTLIGAGAAIIVALLLYNFRGKFTGGGGEDEESDDWRAR